MTGLYKPTAGTVTITAADVRMRVDTLAGDHIVTKAGIARTFQNIRLFRRMTALENLLIARHTALSGHGLLQVAGLFGLRVYRRKEGEAVEKAMGWLRQTKLAERADDLAGDLSYGQQRRLEIARAMCLDPRFLCLDEAAAGLNPKESAELGEDLRKLKQENGIGVLLIEHDMSVVMNVSDRVVVLEYGRKLAEGTPAEIGKGEIVALLGANGAGKSTLLRTVFGKPALLYGSISFNGQPLMTRQAHEVAALGIAHSPEGRRIMPKMTVLN
ncbi:ATP-binding cassette domain-containing protein [Mesorhizobium sp. 2RAF21]|uniref:ABC transporter ATP-binding protein n=1 Tax=Mesorhizobium sp. 2RAF21 TaxID=3232995 RepID=UPI003F9B8610